MRTGSMPSEPWVSPAPLHTAEKPGGTDPLAEKSVENVSYLNDQFNRARNVGQDGK